MKWVITICLIVLCISGYAQFGVYYITFDSMPQDSIKNLRIDTIQNPNNIWQIGIPNKTKFDSAYSVPNSIVTDTLMPYPTSDTSSFLIYHLADNGFTFPHTAGIGGHYMCDSDSLNDFGYIEFSPDNGKTWVNLNLDSTIWFTNNQSKTPSFTGSTKNWVEFEANIGHYGSIYNIQQEDTIIFKFTFISDSIADSRDGWMLDNIVLFDIAESIFEYSSSSLIQIIPNPSSHYIAITSEELGHSTFRVEFFNSQGKLLLEHEAVSNNGFQLDINDLPKGMSILKLSDLRMKKEYFGRFIKE